jgi:hypothetical protein
MEDNLFYGTGFMTEIERSLIYGKLIENIKQEKLRLCPSRY